MSILALALAGLGLAGAQVALAFYLVTWAKGAEGKLRDELKDTADLKVRLLNHAIAITERDTAISGKVQEVGRLKRSLSAVEKQRDDALELVQQLAAKDPRVLTTAMRDQLERLRAFSSKVPDVPEAPATTPSEDR